MKKIVVAVFLLSACVFAQTGANQQGTSQSGSQTSAPQPAKPVPQAQRTPQTQKPLTIVTTVVLVPVTVKDGRGDLVPNLEKSDFRVFQDGKEQQIANFWDQAFPVSAVVLLDDDLPTNESQKVQQSLDSVAAGFSAADEVALVRFDEFQKTILDFTSNNDALFAKLKEIRTNPKDALDSRIAGTPSFPMTSPPRLNGQTLGGADDIPILGTSNNGVTKHIDDAVHYAAEMLRTRGRDRRKIVFIISDGTNDRHNQWSYNSTLELLLSTNVSVYAVSVSSVADVLALRGRGRLGQYATPTGGDVVSASSPQEMEPLYSKLTDEARNEYTIGFQPTRTIGRGSCHSLEVRVERPGLAVFARQGYCAAFPR